MQQPEQRPTAAWPAVLSILGLVVLALVVQWQEKRHGIGKPESHGLESTCPADPELVCTDVNHAQRQERHEQE